MISYVKLSRNHTGKNLNNYYCLRCGTILATSQEEFLKKGTVRHSYINPAGIRCEFMTFSRCENVIVDEGRYAEHSWFEGYTWRFVFCANCLCHLGWQYDPLDGAEQEMSFFGLLLNAVSFASVN